MFKNFLATLFFLSVFVLSQHGEASQSWSQPKIVGKNLLFWSGANVALDAKGNAVALFACYTPKTLIATKTCSIKL